MPNLDLFGNVIASELPIAAPLEASGAKTAPRPIDVKPICQSSFDSDVIRPYHVIREGNLTWILHYYSFFYVLMVISRFLLASRATRGHQKPKQEHTLLPQRMTQ
jgi:hypothetical protein